MLNLSPKNWKNAHLARDIMGDVMKKAPIERQRLWTEIRNTQPVLDLAYQELKSDLQANEAMEIKLNLMILYLYFQKKANIKKYAITKEDLRNSQKRNNSFMKYFSGENRESQKKITLMDLLKLKSKALFGCLFARIERLPTLAAVSEKHKTKILLETKALIEVFERKLLWTTIDHGLKPVATDRELLWSLLCFNAY